MGGTSTVAKLCLANGAIRATAGGVAASSPQGVTLRRWSLRGSGVARPTIWATTESRRRVSRGEHQEFGRRR
eukprot:scaffold56707_cov21-Phaeocystis_antarctica.AAC.1